MASHTFTADTHIGPIVHVGTYEDVFGYDYLWKSDAEAEEEEGRVVCNDYSHQKMGERIVEEANRVFSKQKPLDKYGVTEIKATKFCSPREYNFMTDWLDLLVTVDDAFFDKARAAILDPANRKLVVDTTVECWVSRDGFISAMLDRVHGLSRDQWRHKRYGTHLSTDDEVYAAITADVSDALSEMRDGTGDNETEQMSVMLKLLWSIEYPDDFRDPYWGWVADDMYEHIRGNSSLSEFCTVLDADEVKAKFGDEMVDLDAYLRERRKECELYRLAEFNDPERAKRVSENYERLLSKRIDELKNDQLQAIRDYMPNEERVRAELRKFRTETWANMVAAVFDRQFWRDPELEKAAKELEKEARQ